MIKTHDTGRKRGNLMKYHIYIDESGNTGEPRYKTDKQAWNWGEQIYFALGGISIPNEAEDETRTGLLKILQSFDPALGSSKEWKSKADNLFNRELMKEVIQLLIQNRGMVYVDITNKKYKLANYFVDYCVFPYYLMLDSAFDKREKRIAIANEIYNNWDDQLLARFVDLCHQGLETEDNLNEFLAFLKEAEQYLAKKSIVQDLSAVIDRVEHSDTYKMKRKNLMPIMDYDNRGNPLCFSPNVDAYLNLAATMAYRQSKLKPSIHIFHDEQKQFIPALEQWTKKLREQNGLTLDAFTPLSSDDLLIQLSDFIAGKLIRVYRDVVNDSAPKRDTRELIKVIKPIIAGNCNVVATRYEQIRFFSAFGLKTRPTPIPVPFNRVL